MKTLILLFALSSASGFAADLTVTEISSKENQDGNYAARTYKTNFYGQSEPTYYELVPATIEIENAIKRCPRARVSGSVLSRSTGYEPMARGREIEIVKFLVRALTPGC